MVPPAVALTLDAVFVTCKSAPSTLKTAVAVLVLVPSAVVNEPEGTVFVTVPREELVTTAVTVHVAPGGMTVPDESVNVPAPGVAPTTPPTQLVAAAGVAAFTRPDGYTSVNSAVSVAETNAWVFVMLIVRTALPPAGIDATEKLLEIVGEEGETVSVSVAEQTPEPQAGLVLVTLAGGVMDATLLTCVCA